MLKFYTAQYRYSGKDRLDITVKTGNKLFAPTWDMVTSVKNDSLSKEEYQKQYKKLMIKSYNKNRIEWEKLLSRDEVTLVCFCAKGEFCHRLLLAKLFAKLGAEYMGER